MVYAVQHILRSWHPLSRTASVEVKPCPILTRITRFSSRCLAIAPRFPGVFFNFQRRFFFVFIELSGVFPTILRRFTCEFPTLPAPCEGGQVFKTAPPASKRGKNSRDAREKAHIVLLPRYARRSRSPCSTRNRNGETARHSDT